jgi:uncharacterized membrane-anchored protein
MFFSAIYIWFALPLLGGLFYLLAVAKVFRDSVLLGLVMLLFWPAGIYAMIRYWGDRDNDIRGRMLTSCVFFGAWTALNLADVTISLPQHNRPSASASRLQNGASNADDLDQQLRLATAVATLPLQTGHIEIPQAHATVDVPAHFRFIDRNALEGLYRETGESLDASSVGWLVHESVNLADDNAWLVEIDWYPDGFVREGSVAGVSAEALLIDAKRVTARLAEQQGAGAGDYELVRYAEAPVFDSNGHGATWVEETSTAGQPEHALDCYAVKLGRHGALTFGITDLTLQRQELCLRSVRLAAARTAFSAGHAYTDHWRFFDAAAKYELADLITGAAMLPRP